MLSSHHAFKLIITTNLNMNIMDRVLVLKLKALMHVTIRISGNKSKATSWSGFFMLRRHGMMDDCRCLKMNFLVLNIYFIASRIYIVKGGLKYIQGNIINVMEKDAI